MKKGNKKLPAFKQLTLNLQSKYRDEDRVDSQSEESQKSDSKKTQKVWWSRVLDFQDLELNVSIYHNLLQDQKELYESPFVSEDADFDFGQVHFDPQAQAVEIENQSLEIRKLSQGEMKVHEDGLEFYLQKLNAFAQQAIDERIKNGPSEKENTFQKNVANQRKRKIKLDDAVYETNTREFSECFDIAKKKSHSLSHFTIEEKISMSHSILISKHGIIEVAAAF